MSDVEINEYFNAKNKYQEQYNKQMAKLKDAGDLSSAEMHKELLKFSANRKCIKCFKIGGMSFEETKSNLYAKCLAGKPCFSINIKRVIVTDLWESFRTNKSVLNDLDKSVIIMKYRSQNYIPTEKTDTRKATQYNSSKKGTNSNSPYSTEINDVIRDFSDIEQKRNKEKKIEKDIEKTINKVKNNNAAEIAEAELTILEMYDTLRNFQGNDITTLKKQISLNRTQQTNYDNLRPIKYAYFAIEEDDGKPPDFSLVTREYSTQQCEYVGLTP